MQKALRAGSWKYLQKRSGQMPCSAACWCAVAGGPAGDVRPTAAEDGSAARPAGCLCSSGACQRLQGGRAGRLPAETPLCIAAPLTAAAGSAPLEGARRPRPAPSAPRAAFAQYHRVVQGYTPSAQTQWQPCRRSTDSSLFRITILSQTGRGPGWTAQHWQRESMSSCSPGHGAG